MQFQSTPPRGGRQIAAVHRIVRTHVSIHAPARGATTALSVIVTKVKRFNPRPREGGDRKARVSGDSNVVSIHAPARGATC